MYIDLIVLIILVIVALMFFRRFSSFVFLMAIIDLFLRILAFIKNNIGLSDVSQIIGKYLPESMFDIIDKYTYSIPTLCIVIKWAYVCLMIVFLVYITKIFLKGKKI